MADPGKSKDEIGGVWRRRVWIGGKDGSFKDVNDVAGGKDLKRVRIRVMERNVEDTGSEARRCIMLR